MRERGDKVSAADNLETIFEVITMKHIRNIAIVAVLVVAVGAVVAIKQSKKAIKAFTPPVETVGVSEPVSQNSAPSNSQPAKPDAVQTLPKLVDLGAGKCIPCKMMAPVIEELEKEFAGKVTFEKINIDRETEKASQYGVMSIPTCVLEKDGKEVERLIGARPKEEFLALFQKHQPA